MNAIIKLSERLSSVLTMIAGVALLWMMLLLIGNIALRFIATPIHGTYELVQMTAVFVLGLALAEAQVSKSHVSISLVMEKRSKRTQLVVGTIVTVIAIALFALVVSALWDYGLNLRSVGSATESLGIPLWPSVFALLAGVAVLVLVLLADLVQIYNSARSDDREVHIW